MSARPDPDAQARALSGASFGTRAGPHAEEPADAAFRAAAAAAAVAVPTRRLAANRPVLLNRHAGAWRIEAGAVDLFCVAADDRTVERAREHVCRFESGATVFGLDCPGAAFGLLAVGLPQTLWRPLDEAELAGAFVDGRADAWIARLRQTLGADPDHGRDEGHTPGHTPGHIPGHDHDPGRDHGGDARKLAAFHAWLLDALGQRVRVSGSQSLEQLLRRASVERRAFDGSLGGLARVLDEPSDEPGTRRRASLTGSGDALVDAMTPVLAALGVDARLAPPSLEPAAIAGRRQVAGAAGHADATLATRLDALCRQAGVVYREVSIDRPRWWREDAGALLGWRRADGAPVALLPATLGYVWLDPDSGQRHPVDEDAAAGFEVTALMFYRSFGQQPMNLRSLFAFGLRGGGVDRWHLVSYGLAGGFLGLLPPIFTGLLYDKVIPSANAAELVYLVAMLLAAMLAIVIFKFCRGVALMRIERRLGNSVSAAILDRMLHLPARFFRDFSAASVAFRASSVEGALLLMTSATEMAVFGWLFGLISLGFMFFLDIRLALLAVALVVLALGVSVTVNLLRQRLEREHLQITGMNAGGIFQALSGIAKLRACGAERRAFTRWATGAAREKTVFLRLRRLGNLLRAVEAGQTVFCALMLYGATVALSPDIAPGVFLAFATAFAQFMASTLALSAAMTSLFNAMAQYERARPLLAALPEIESQRQDPGLLSGAIDISEISFRYDGRPAAPMVLDRVSIHVAAGEFVAIVGTSGAGKSTLLRLLLGFERQSSGGIYFDGHESSTLDMIAVRRQFGVVLQNSRLLPGDLFSNIVGSGPLTLEDAWEAARQAGLEDDIRAMPMGMHTQIIDGATTLSGGQRQRLMIARAIAGKPAILLFDEATSALDNPSQAAIAAALENLRATRIVVAHRLSTIRHADRIVVIDRGAIVETGTYDTLLARDGQFTRLARQQIDHDD